MKRKAPKNILVTIALRLLPLVSLPLLVAVLQPDSDAGEGWKMILVGAACGVVISAAVPSLRIALLAVAIVTVLLLSVAYTEALHHQLHLGNDHDEPRPPRPMLLQEKSDVASAAAALPLDVERKRLAAQEVAALRWRPAPPKIEAPVEMATFSVVLPCAFEGEFAEKTVWAVWENTDKNILKEIIVVDDGSRPPLRKIMSEQLLSQGPGVPKMKIVRHERTLGLISAKKSGGDAATGDVIVFFDCHVSPRKGWEMAFLKQMKRKQDHRTIVVPTITSLNPDTWKEIPGGGGGKVCFILWNNDFTWLYNPGRDAPLMSGGLLALSRRWWEETGGYDTKMVAWGGENIDQSLRSWLCGGRIEVADGAFVAHMWRDPKNPKTVLRYPIPTKDVMRNKARAATAWFGEFTEKVMTFPEYEMFTKNGETIGDMSEFGQLKQKLGCAPFASYLDRFSYIYLDGGLLPAEVFQLREKKTGLCLHVKRNDRAPHNVVLAACAGHHEEHQSSELQLFHRGNRDQSKRGKPCCSGIMHWNFLQCLDAQRVGRSVIRDSLSACSATVELLTESSSLRGEASSGEVKELRGAASFRLKRKDMKPALPPCRPALQGLSTQFSLLVSKEGGGCAAAATKEGGGDSASNMELHFRPCDEKDAGQTFHAKPRFGGFEIKVGETGYCLDSGGGSQALVYPCYDEKVHNMNQVWKIRDGRLLWESGGRVICVDSEKIQEKVKAPQGEYRLVTCAPKPGQRLKREEIDSQGTFLLKDQDDGRCLSALSGNVLGLSECTAKQRWRVLAANGFHQVQHCESKLCIDAGSEQKPILYPCHTGRVNQPQKFTVVDEPGWIQNPLTWGDNGRRRSFESCLDRLPTQHQSVAVQECSEVRQAGVQWERLNVFVPLERRLWEKAAKPPPGTPILGGDMAPP
ncbi:Polypeptide N-acetylgalactosaminyltransferase 12 (Polypeptide GalNAc transferase 12) (GalNAc-T12) (pp-GaNTase 12) (Protein-UDP acetylgalactosaminyltransferase 12) (UDP-GalNAc:polypeptide N-acetylgalactosaminyltransferase 12) [Durusdinium trenchii]|uniref:Polypeptide N-acetylgalactosaminyltransferase n=1 Tax=Durusdinium trenchii TaxID=1381693 RepID=A0ABP0QJ52_9DINO